MGIARAWRGADACHGPWTAGMGEGVIDGCCAVSNCPAPSPVPASRLASCRGETSACQAGVARCNHGSATRRQLDGSATGRCHGRRGELSARSRHCQQMPAADCLPKHVSSVSAAVPQALPAEMPCTAPTIGRRKPEVPAPRLLRDFSSTPTLSLSTASTRAWPANLVHRPLGAIERVNSSKPPPIDVAPGPRGFLFRLTYRVRVAGFRRRLGTPRPSQDIPNHAPSPSRRLRRPS